MRPVGPGRVLLGTYLLFVVAAGARSVVQLSTHAARAPVAYGLSFVAAGVYGVGFVLLRRVERGGPVTGLRWCSALELAGVLAVGTASVLDRHAFRDATVWSCYGAGYLFVPILLPVAVLAFAHRSPATSTRRCDHLQACPPRAVGH